MSLQSVVQGVWAIGLVLQFLLAATLLAKKAWGKFPLFVAYSVFNLIESAVMYALLSHSVAYFYAYVAGETVAVALGLAVVYEIFTRLFFLYPGLRRVTRLSLYGVVAMLAVLAVAVLSSHTPIEKNGVLQAVFLVEEAARVVEVGLLTFLFVFYSLFGLHWRQSVFGITLGLGIYTVVKLLALTLMPYLSPSGGLAGNLISVLAFDCSLLIWLGYMLAPERVINTGELPQRAQLEQWNQAIMELINQ
jgi:hypothetical protein